MISIVTSCISPPEQVNGKQRSFVPVKERELQTILTIQKLIEVGFDQVILVDNSDYFDFSGIKSQFPEKLEIIHFQQYQFSNKGINEILLLLAALPHVPDDIPIFKISGRYYPAENFSLDFAGEFDFRFKGEKFKNRTGAVSTRAYFVRNKAIYEQFLLGCLEEIYAHSHRVVGIKSFFKMLVETFWPGTASSFTVPVEFAAARVLKYGNFSYQLVNPIGIEGRIAGFENLELIKE